MLLLRGGQLFTVVSVGSGELSSEQQMKLGKIQQESTTVSTQFVQVAFVKDLQQGGVINLQMPGKDCTAQVKAKTIEACSNGDYYWYGEVEKEDGETEEECECYNGSVTVISRAGRVFGSVHIDDDHWSLHELGGGKRVLARRDYTNNVLECAMPDSGGKIVAEAMAQDRTEVNCPVRVLALYTPNAEAAAADLEDRILTAFVNANQILRNSKVTPNQLTFILHSIQLFDFDETDNIQDDVTTLVSDAMVAQMRDDTQADLVVVYTDGEYSLWGVAGALGPSSGSALCIVNRVGESLHTTAHEMAHLLGCRHDIYDDPNGDFEHGHIFKTGCWPFRDKQKTVMYVPVSPQRIPYFSNPDVYYKKESTGTEEYENNARQLRTNACTVAAFRTDDVSSPFKVIPSSDQEACPCAYTTFYASGVGGGPGPYQFEWYTSTDGFTYGTLQGIGSVFSVNAPCTPGANLHIKVKGISSDNQTHEAFTYVVAIDPGFPSNCDRNNRVANTQEEFVTLMPNPAGEAVLLTIQSPSAANVAFSLNDAVGRLLSQQSFPVEKGQTQGRLDTSALSPGVYFLQVRVGDRLISQKFVKN
ncbi:MAG: zinc-dependent metalloprotease [Saprospiraceae bacterium]|nr:zinc-dependent metalloprotease [Saprospiraceae bacterium]